MAPLTDGTNGMTGTPGERFDDDRLLAYALHLEEDAELEQALSTDAALRERLLAMRADLSAVEDQVRAAAPAPQESWADLSAARWDGLRPYVTTTPARAPRRRRFGVRVLGPVVGVAAAAALAVGIVLSQSGGVNSTTSGGAEFGPVSTSGGVAATGSASGSTKSFSIASPTAAADAAAYQTAVVARAGAVANGVQDFAVVRTIKGDIGATVQLSVEVGGAVKQGALALLLLTPSDKLNVPPTTTAPGAVPSPTTTQARSPQGHLYLYQGTPAVVQTLPTGTDPNAVTLP
jgi:hypothetical protein